MGIAASAENDGRVHVAQVPGWAGWTFVVAVDYTGDEPRAAGVTVTPPSPEALTSVNLRALPYGKVLRAASGIYSPTVNPIVALVAASVDAPERRPYGGSDEHRAAVVALWHTARSQGVAPRAVIAERFDVDKSTVSRWLRDLRHRGLLGDYDEKQHAMNVPTTPVVGTAERPRPHRVRHTEGGEDR